MDGVDHPPVLNTARTILIKAEKKKYDYNDDYNPTAISTKPAASKATTHKNTPPS
jgi:hypothetical protein